MHITFINQFYPPDISPTAHLTASLAEHRAGSGDTVSVITGGGGYTPVQGAETHTTGAAAPVVYRVWTPRLGKSTLLTRCVDYLSFFLQAIWRMATLPPQDVVVSLTTPPYIVLAGIAHKLLHPRTKLVLWNMDCYPDVAERSAMIRPGGALSRLLRGLNRFIFRRLDHLVCLDSAMAELLLSQYGPSGYALPTTVIPNWERASLFPADATPEPWGEAEALGLRGNFVVLYLGNTGVGHDFETVLQAAEALRHAPVRFLFIGGGVRWKHLEAAKRARGLDNVVLRGYVPKELTPSVMASADCALITLQDAALGVMSPSKLHSKLAMGLPVIYVGPRGSNVDEAIENCRCGVSLRHGDVNGMVAFIRRMIDDPAERAALRLRAREGFDTAYCDIRTLPQFDQVFEAVSHGHPAAASSVASFPAAARVPVDSQA